MVRVKSLKKNGKLGESPIIQSGYERGGLWECFCFDVQFSKLSLKQI